jgi:hypothetical protein
MPAEVDLHVHTKYSFDSLLEPRTIIKSALKRGLSAIAITDHNTLKGSLATLREASSIQDLMVILGIEIRTNQGDIVGLFVQNEIDSREFYEVVEEIKRQGGIAILSHPYRGHEKPKSIIKYVDAVEALNGRCLPNENIKAKKLAKVTNTPTVAGSDAHFSFEIGCVRTRFCKELSDTEELRRAILNGDRLLIGKEAPMLVHALSFLVEIIKRVKKIA